MDRVLEAELMDDEAQAHAYAKAEIRSGGGCLHPSFTAAIPSRA